jgi:NAD(P) transhydrogenase subunit alpha
MDLVITTAQIPGRPAPRLVTDEMIASMRPGSVLVDLAAETGGNVAVTRLGETVVVHEVTVLGPSNLPSSLPLHASQMYSRNLQTLLQHLIKDGQVVIDPEEEITKAMLVVHEGRLRD